MGDSFKGERAFKGDGQRLLNGDQVASRHSATRGGSGDSGCAGSGCRCCLTRRHSRFVRARRSVSSCDVIKVCVGSEGAARVGLERLAHMGVGVWGLTIGGAVMCVYWV